MQGAEKLRLVKAYKTVLRDALESRPSGIRLRIASTIGKNKSFISQITNPRYKTPLPEKYLEPILEILHFTPTEREQFLEVYRQAHPRSRSQRTDKQQPTRTRVLRVELPRLGSPTLERKLDALLGEFAREINDLMGRGQS